MSAMLLDSSVVIEALLGRPLHEECAQAMAAPDAAISALAYYECYKLLRGKLGEGDALEALGALERLEIVPVTREISLAAADLARTYALSMADALALASANETGRTLLTLDADFSKIPGATSA